MSAGCVLDSWAVLAYLQGGWGSDSAVMDMAIMDTAVQDVAVINWINLGEVSYILQRRFGKQEAYATVQDLRAMLRVVLPDEAVVLQAADIKADYPLAYADAFAAATAMRWDLPLWTGDPELLIRNAPWRWVDLRG